MVPIQTTSRKLNYIKYLNLIFCDFAMGGAMAPMTPPLDPPLIIIIIIIVSPKTLGCRSAWECHLLCLDFTMLNCNCIIIIIVIITKLFTIIAPSLSVSINVQMLMRSKSVFVIAISNRQRQKCLIEDVGVRPLLHSSGK